MRRGGPATQYTLTIAVEGSGTVTPASGTTHDAGAVVTMVPSAGTGYAFDHWGGADGASVLTSAGVHTITMDGDKSVTAIFTKLDYELTVIVSPPGAGTVAEEIVEARRSYEDGQAVRLTAAANSGYVFAGWSGDLESADNPATLVMDGPKAVTANFTRLNYELTVIVSPAGAGTVTEEIVEARGTYEYGTVVRLTAIADAHYVFCGWTGDLAGTDNPATLAMDGPQTVTACFTAKTYVFENKWGINGNGDGQFSELRGVAVYTDSGNTYIYVTELYNRLQKFSATGTYLAKWGIAGLGDGQFKWPAGVAADAAGHIYVADSENHRLQKFDSSGTYLAKWGLSGGSSGTGDGQFNRPYGVAVDAEGNVYVADMNNHRIQKFDSAGAFLAKWGSSGSGDGQFRYPMGIAVDAAGNVYVADYANNRIQKFATDGTYLAKWGAEGTGDGQFCYPRGVAVDAAGIVYVADTSNHRIQKFTATGTYLAKWGAGGAGNGQFNNPCGVALDADGHVFVADAANFRIQKLRPAD